MFSSMLVGRERSREKEEEEEEALYYHDLTISSSTSALADMMDANFSAI